MSDGFTLRSNEGARLELRGDPRGSRGGSSFTAALVSDQISARVRVYDQFPYKWTGYFRELATNWKGWLGARAMESLEGNIALVATSNSVGQVVLQVVLRDGDGESDWRAERLFQVDAGQLDSVARSAEDYFGTYDDYV